jgi:pimeloyl-ACP methyl ester carboxylesterase
MTHLVFSHANGFGAYTYRLMFESLRARGFTVSAVEQFGHRPELPVTDNWPYLVEELRQHIEAQMQGQEHLPGQAAQAPVLVGHSLGGFLSLMCAAAHPELARAVLLIDSPILGGWRATTLGVAKKTQLVGSFSPGKISQKRRKHWGSVDEVLAHFQRKKNFAAWHPQVLQDYAELGTVERDGQRSLRFDRDVETAIYNTLPDHLSQLIKQHPLQCPVAFIGGRKSAEMRQVGMSMTEQVTKGRISMLDGSHLFPMEKPITTAAAIEASVRNLLGER